MWRVSNVLTLAGLKQAPPISAVKLARSNRRGSYVHAAAEAYAHAEIIPVEDAHRGYFDGVKLWFREFEPIILFTEYRSIDRRLRLTGRIDLGIVTHERYGREPYIVDFKTGSEAAWHALQTVGYCDLADRDRELAKLLDAHDLHRRPWKRSCLYLPGNGTYKWKPFTNPQDGYLFRSALALVQWRYDHGLLTTTDPERPDDDPVPAGSEHAADASDGDGHLV